ncbi:hypothetical protein B0H14DRAFT_3495689 [Mycena olivaceomarginata]|nr:hypothetical protein B0H14DRAFT_3495689 [Mycena olivaceomarginata]
MAHNIPNNQGYAGPYAQTVAFLLGLAPSPSSTNREFAVARINAALDSGIFDGTPFEQDPRANQDSLGDGFSAWSNYRLASIQPSADMLSAVTTQPAVTNKLLPFE